MFSVEFTLPGEPNTCGPPAPCHHRTVQERSADLRTCCMLQPTSMHTQRKQNGGFEPKLGYPPIEKGLFFYHFGYEPKAVNICGISINTTKTAF